MKRIAVSFLISFICNTLIFCQDTAPNKVNLSASLGFIKYTTNDQFVNYFNYSRNAFLPVKLMGYYRRNKNFFFLNVLYNQSKLYPKDLQVGYYEYNYIKYWNIESNLEYYRAILEIQGHLRVSIGIANNLYLVVQKEYFKNLLYDYAEGYRKSYDFSIVNISTNFMVDYNVSKNYVRFRSGYTLLNIAARPDDNYVKQVGLNSGMRWNTYSLKNYKNFQLSLFYQYNISKNIGINAEYAVLFRSYRSPETYNYLSKSFLIGISKTF